VVQFLAGVNIFSSPLCPNELWGPQNPLFNGTKIEQLECETDYAPPTTALVNNALRYNLTSPPNKPTQYAKT